MPDSGSCSHHGSQVKSQSRSRSSTMLNTHRRWGDGCLVLMGGRSLPGTHGGRYLARSSGGSLPLPAAVGQSQLLGPGSLPLLTNPHSTLNTEEANGAALRGRGSGVEPTSAPHAYWPPAGQTSWPHQPFSAALIGSSAKKFQVPKKTTLG